MILIEYCYGCLAFAVIHMMMVSIYINAEIMAVYIKYKAGSQYATEA